MDDQKKAPPDCRVSLARSPYGESTKVSFIIIVFIKTGSFKGRSKKFKILIR